MLEFVGWGLHAAQKWSFGGEEGKRGFWERRHDGPFLWSGG